MRGFFGIGVYHPKTTENIGTLWRSAYLFGADFIFTVGARYHKQPSDTPDTSKHIPLYTYADLDDLVAHLPARSDLVCVELAEKAKELNESHHPERAVYLLGAEDYGIPQDFLVGHQTVIIPTEKTWSMNVAVAGSIVMYDRYVKQDSITTVSG
jgi:tRNA(Leu) C34 or U34 (ribose-2'-O)-methylase TrmL